MKKLITIILRFLALYKLKRIHPIIIGITGSYGKTTLKEVIAAMMSANYKVLKSKKSLNTEIGMCLAILEQNSGFSNPIKWIEILILATLNSLFSKPFDFCILEYGVDKPGDMNDLLRVAKPDCAVITAIAQLHQAKGQFSSIDEVQSEKIKLAHAVKRGGHVILNHSYKQLHHAGSSVRAIVTYYNDAHIYADKLEQTKEGIRGFIHINKEKHELNMPVIGKYHSDCALVAYIIGELYSIPKEKIQYALNHFELPPGRMSLIKGKHGCTLIDSSYNASPNTVENALTILKDFPAKRRIALLGTMNELGDFFERGHNQVATAINDWLDVFIGVGDGGKFIAEQLLNQPTKPATIKSFAEAFEAAHYLEHTLKLREGDVILIKGSQNKVRLERAVKALMAHPETASQLLCRQESEWQKK